MSFDNKYAISLTQLPRGRVLNNILHCIQCKILIKTRPQGKLIESLIYLQ